MRPLPDEDPKLGTTAAGASSAHALVDIAPDHVMCSDGRGEPRDFTYPRSVIPGPMNQEQTYATMMMPELIQKFLFEGQHCTLVAYGQTGSGKTHTMFGAGMEEDESGLGLLPRAMLTALEQMEALRQAGTHKFVFSATAIELYGIEVFDLLNEKAQVQISAFSGRGFDFEQCKEMVISSQSDVQNLLRILFTERTSRGTKMNDRSSRAHCIATLNLTRVTEEAGKKMCYRSSFSFADLCGSERTSKTAATKTSATGGEGIGINYDLSLLHFAVEQAVQQQGKSNSKKLERADGILSKVLKTALDGESLTNLVVCCSQEARNGGETFFTLKWGEDMSRLRLRKQAQQGKDLEKELERIGKEIKEEEDAIKKLEASPSGKQNKFYAKRTMRVAQLRTQREFMSSLM